MTGLTVSAILLNLSKSRSLVSDFGCSVSSANWRPSRFWGGGLDLLFSLVRGLFKGLLPQNVLGSSDLDLCGLLQHLHLSGQ